MKSFSKCLLRVAGTFIIISVEMAGCRQHPIVPVRKDVLFQLLSPDSTHVDFNNVLTEGLNTNVLLYEYFYNGGGVAIGDMNGDGLQDIYFSGNMTGNKLYLNKGHMQFQDITAMADVAGRPGPWKTGVAIADVNGDGRPDIFLCYSGKMPGARRVKQLFINEGNDSMGIPHFSEQAARYGLDDSSYTTQAYFFDYDLDGDLDLLLLNHNPNSLPVLNEASTALILKQPDPMCGVRLLRNDNGHFHDVTVRSGISSSALTYGLGAGIADINGDGWPDIYISNDYAVPDYCYINQHDGTFTNQLTRCFNHISQFSMGNSIADINNDGLPDIFTLDMLPEDVRRQKLLFAPDNYEKFDLNLRSGFYYQYMRNMLQLNEGNGHFSEIGQLSGISNTDWSWAPLWADFDNDGWKDLFITNGYRRDYTNMDFIKYLESFTAGPRHRLQREDVLNIVHHMPASNVVSYVFRNNGDLRFTNMDSAWGIRLPANSNGAAWADLDNDGDLDLVVNNIDQPAFIYANMARQQGENHFLSIRLKGRRYNTQGVGTRVTLYRKGRLQLLEQMPTQGYQSTVSPILHFGLGADSVIDSLRVVWPGGLQQVINSVSSDREIVLDERDAGGRFSPPAPLPTIFKEVASPVRYVHQQAVVNDFKRQPLLPNPLSFGGPCMAKADVNGDGLEDLYIGGGSGKAGALYLQERDGQLKLLSEPAFEACKQYEDADAVFFDANGDGFVDLYVASGGYHQYCAGDSLLEDRLYLGDGSAHFSRSRDALPMMRVAKGVVCVADVNGDGAPDLFVGGRCIPGLYPTTPASYLLLNDGKGHFTDVIQSWAPGLQYIGMVTDAAWADMDGDGRPDLVVAGEWMALSVFVNKGSRLEDETQRYFDRPYRGWWNRIWVGDLDGDGRPEIIAGNLGENSQCKVDQRHPAELYYKDFDGNGTIDPILCFYVGDTSHPFLTRDELLAQVGNMSKRFPDYRSFAGARIGDVFRGDELKGAGKLEANCLRTCYFGWGHDNRLHERNLPLEVQFAPIFTITPLDYDGDGHKDLLLCGNIDHARLRFGKYDANYGILLHNDGKGHFQYIEQRRSGFYCRGDVRAVVQLGSTLLMGMNGREIKAYRPW